MTQTASHPSIPCGAGGLHSKWTGGALRVHPGGWIAEVGDGSSIYSAISDCASSPAGSPMPPYSPAPHRHSLVVAHRAVSTPAALGLFAGFFLPTSTPASGVLRTLATAAMLDFPALGLGTPAFGYFPPMPPLSSLAAPATEGHGKEG